MAAPATGRETLAGDRAGAPGRDDAADRLPAAVETP
jgi:hypothetical protein